MKAHARDHGIDYGKSQMTFGIYRNTSAADRAFHRALEKLHFLIVDPSRFSRTLLKGALQSYGLRDFIETETAADALKMLRYEELDFVLADFDMPDMDGAHFTRLVRLGDGGPDPEIPVMIVAADADEHRVMAAAAAGVHEFVVKPFTAESLYSRIRFTVEHPRPFIRTESYIGPDRRMIDNGPPEGRAERRNKIKG